MGWVLFGIGISWVMFGTLMVFAPETVEKGCYDKLRGKNSKALSPFPLLGGALLFFSASSSSQPGFIVVLGFLFLAKGALFLFSAQKGGKRFTDWWFSAPRKTHQVCGAVVIVLGICVLASLAPLIK